MCGDVEIEIIYNRISVTMKKNKVTGDNTDIGLGNVTFSVCSLSAFDGLRVQAQITHFMHSQFCMFQLIHTVVLVWHQLKCNTDKNQQSHYI